MPRALLIEAMLALFGALGFLLASYINHCHRKKAPLVCPMRGSCEFVTKSGYSEFLGIRVERLGMAYYLCVFAFHALALVEPSLLASGTLRIALLISTLAFFFSLYLIGVQAFVLRQWCTWCVCSALLCAGIFLLALASLPAGFL